MRKKILFLFCLMLMPFMVLGEGYINVSRSSITIEEGSSTSFQITAFNAVGDAKISINNSNVSVDNKKFETGVVGDHQTISKTYRVYGNTPGTSKITVSINGATFDEEDLSNSSRTITVTVTKKVVTNDVVEENNIEEKKSDNNKLKSISVDGYNLVKIDDNNYKLEVNNSVESIRINAVKEDDTATLTGNGTKSLKVGDNSFKVTITSESGLENIINIVVTRKSPVEIQEIKERIEEIKESDKNVEILIKEDTVINKEDLELLKQVDNIINLSYKEDDKLLYNWSINGNKLDDIEEINTKIVIVNENPIAEKKTDSKGVFINIENETKLPDDTKVRILIDRENSTNRKVNVYYYDKDNDNVELLLGDALVDDGYIEFEYKVSPYYLIEDVETVSNNEGGHNYLVITMIVLVVILVLVFILRGKKK